ncbi:MAG TPA: PQQ-binding-like beta-propeller repeat protein, partial [Thermoanaerobaculia bacterium]
LYRIEMRTGRVTDRMALPATPSATAAFDGRYLHLPLHDTTYAVVDVRERRVVSRFDTRHPVRAVPLLDAAGAAYVLTEAATVLRILPDSMELLAELGGAARASLALAANGLLVGRLDGALFFLDFDGNVVWRKDMDDSIDAPAAVYDGRVYVPMLRGELVALEAAS